jgi:hypothetical protein
VELEGKPDSEEAMQRIAAWVNHADRRSAGIDLERRIEE